jgi:hypothetical protein
MRESVMYMMANFPEQIQATAEFLDGYFTPYFPQTIAGAAGTAASSCGTDRSCNGSNTP